MHVFVILYQFTAEVSSGSTLEWHIFSPAIFIVFDGNHHYGDVSQQVMQYINPINTQ